MLAAPEVELGAWVTGQCGQHWAVSLRRVGQADTGGGRVTSQELELTKDGDYPEVYVVVYMWTHVNMCVTGLYEMQNAF